MRIRDVRVLSASGRRRSELLVKVETDEGLCGWGQSGLLSRELAVEGALRHFREFLVGRDPLQRGRLWQEMYRSQYFEGGRVLAAAVSAVDIALHDLAGKKLGVPVYELLGGRQRDFVPLFATTTADTPSETLAQAKRIVADGWPAVRFVWLAPAARDADVFEPRESMPGMAEFLILAREELGPEPVLGFDCHHRLGVAEAASFCQMLERRTLDFLEEPIRAESTSAYEALRRMVEIPFAVGEEFASKWDFVPYLERGILGFARVDVCTAGGFTEAMKIAGWCEAHYVDLMPHNPLGPIGTAASAHLATAVPNMAWLEVFEALPEERGQVYDPEIFRVRWELAPGKLVLPDRPGLGVEVNEEALADQFPLWELPRLRRRDGSVTNW